VQRVAPAGQKTSVDIGSNLVINKGTVFHHCRPATTSPISSGGRHWVDWDRPVHPHLPEGVPENHADTGGNERSAAYTEAVS